MHTDKTNCLITDTHCKLLNNKKSQYKMFTTPVIFAGAAKTLGALIFNLILGQKYSFVTLKACLN